MPICRFVGNLLKGQTVGVIGAGRIGSAYARMMIEGFKMNLIYYDLYQATRLEKFVTAYGQFLKANGEQPVTWKRAATMEDVLREADVVSQLIDFFSPSYTCIIIIIYIHNLPLQLI